MTVGLTHYLIVAAALFCLGLYTVATRRNAVAVLMGVELVLNSAGLNLIAFQRYTAVGSLDGHVFTIFLIALAAAEATIALAIVVSLYMTFRTSRADEANLLRE